MHFKTVISQMFFIYQYLMGNWWPSSQSRFNTNELVEKTPLDAPEQRAYSCSTTRYFKSLSHTEILKS
jgi:hypothetical protein